MIILLPSGSDAWNPSSAGAVPDEIRDRFLEIGDLGGRDKGRINSTSTNVLKTNPSERSTRLTAAGARPMVCG
jgi:hypothetical protein